MFLQKFQILLVFLSVVGFGSTQLIFPNASLPNISGTFSINNILGNYYLNAAFCKQESEFLPDLSSSCDIKVSVRINLKGIVTMTFVYFDQTKNKKMTANYQYLVSPYEPTVLINQLGTIYKFKYYKGQDDLIVVYYGEKDGQVILQKKDGSIALLLSRTSTPPSDFNFLNIGTNSLGFEKEDFINFNNSHCNQLLS